MESKKKNNKHSQRQKVEQWWGREVGGGLVKRYKVVVQSRDAPMLYFGKETSWGNLMPKEATRSF